LERRARGVNDESTSSLGLSREKVSEKYRLRARGREMYTERKVFSICDYKIC